MTDSTLTHGGAPEPASPGPSKALVAVQTWRVVALALLGNAYLGLVIALLLCVLLFLLAAVLKMHLIVLKLLVIVAVFLWKILPALWVKFEPPQGHVVTRQQAPELFAMLDQLYAALKTPKFHHVLIVDEFNAAVSQVPRLGIFGWPKNYLIIGLPLMKLLTPQQFKAVVAHEMGHLARSHGAMANWVYRQRLRWSRLMAVLEANEDKGGFLFKPFLTWYAPAFSAYSFPLARVNEYQADASAVALTSRDAAAQALTSVNVLGAYLSETYWPGVTRQANDHPHPAFSPFAELGAARLADCRDDDLRRWLDRAMALETGQTDTHPALRDRLQAMGAQPALALPMQGQAADQLLGAGLAPITAALDRDWRKRIEPVWTEHFEQVKQSRASLAELNQRVAAGEALSAQQAYDRAVLTRKYGDDLAGALAQFEALHALLPDDPSPAMLLASCLLERDPDGSVDRAQQLLERVVQQDPTMAVQAYEMLRDFHWQRGDIDLARAWHRQYLDAADVHAIAHDERNQVRIKDEYDTDSLSDELRDAIRQAVHAIADVKRCWLVRKRLKAWPERPCWVLAFSVTGRFSRFDAAKAARVQRQLMDTVPFPGETLVIHVDGVNKHFGKKIRQTVGVQPLVER